MIKKIIFLIYIVSYTALGQGSNPNKIIRYSDLDSILIARLGDIGTDSVTVLNMISDSLLNVVRKTGTDTISGQKIFTNNKTVFGVTTSDSVGLRGRLKVDGLTTLNLQTTIGASGNTSNRLIVNGNGIIQNNFTITDLFFANKSGLELSLGDYLGSETGSYININIPESKINIWADSTNISGNLNILGEFIIDGDTLDVNINNPQVDQFLKYIDGHWTNTTVSLGGAIGNADSLGSIPAGSYLLKTGFTDSMATLRNGLNAWSSGLTASSNVLRLGKTHADRRFNHGAYSDVWIIDYVVPPYNLPEAFNIAHEHRTDYYNDTLKDFTNVFNLFNIDGTGTPIWGADPNIVLHKFGVGVGDLPDSVGLDWAWDDFVGIDLQMFDEANMTVGAKRFPMPMYGYRFRFGGTMSNYTMPKVYGFYSDFTTFGDQARVDSGWHFYGKGDFPSYFGGNLQVAGEITSALPDMVGDGTTTNPFQISFIEQLDSVRNNLDANYVLVNDLDFKSDLSYWTPANKTNYIAGTGWLPIGTGSSDKFVGDFNGNNKIISNLYIKRPATNNVGLFGYVSDSTCSIYDLTVNADTIIGAINVGIITGHALTFANITNCHTSGYVEGTNNEVGGICGMSSGLLGDVDWLNCSSSATVVGIDEVGGLLGACPSSNITNCYATGSVTGDDYVGGLIGFIEAGAIVVSSFATGNVTGDNQVGGFGGIIQIPDASSVTNCYATGDVVADSSVGGFIGHNDIGVISKCYSVGSVTGNTNVGGLVGLQSTGTTSNSYYDQSTSGQSDNTSKGFPQTTVDMKDTLIYSSVGSWSIALYENLTTEDWKILRYYDYPKLKWEQTTTDQIMGNLKNKFETLVFPIPLMDTVIVGRLPGYKMPTNITITEIAAYTDAGTVTFNVEECGETTPNTAGTDAMSSDLVADTNQQETLIFSNANFAINSWMVLTISNVTGDPSIFSVSIRYTKQ